MKRYERIAWMITLAVFFILSNSIVSIKEPEPRYTCIENDNKLLDCKKCEYRDGIEICWKVDNIDFYEATHGTEISL